MSELHNARATAHSHITSDTTRQFDVALHSAATSCIESMNLLQRAVCDCVSALKNGNVTPVDMILAMKACAHDSAGRYRPPREAQPASNVNQQMLFASGTSGCVAKRNMARADRTPFPAHSSPRPRTGRMLARCQSR